MRRRNRLASLQLFVVVCALVCVHGVAAAPPNVLLLMLEDLSPRMGAYGDEVAHTPNIDRLAAQGVRFTQVFSTAGVCAPSRASIITGLHQAALHAQHMRTSSRPAGGYAAMPPAEVKAFPELLRAHGYFTFTSRKLDYQFSGTFTGSGPFTIWDAESGLTDDAENGAALWRQTPEGSPFFGYLNFFRTHESNLFPTLGSWPRSFMHFMFQLRRFADDLPDPSAALTDPEAVIVPPYYADVPSVREDIARHYDNIRQQDAEVGAVLAQLESDGLLDQTIILLSTDHGDALPRAKRELYDSGLHVPLIVRWPAHLQPAEIARGSSDDRLISFVDLAPTILAMAGVSLPSYLHGRDIFGSDSARQYVFAGRDRIDEVPDRQRAVRDRRFKLIRSDYPQQEGGHPLRFRDHIEMVRVMRTLLEDGELTDAQTLWYQPPGEVRLFDLDADPHELRNVADDPAYADHRRRLLNALEEWLRRVGDAEEVPEDELVVRIQPDGSQQQTAAPTFASADGALRIQSATPGASIGYRIGDGRWRLYTGPLKPEVGTVVTAKAVRYGFSESEERNSKSAN